MRAWAVWAGVRTADGGGPVPPRWVLTKGHRPELLGLADDTTTNWLLLSGGFVAGRVHRPAVGPHRKAQEAAGGHNFKTGGGKVTVMDGPPPPQRVAITEWESLEKAQAFFKSKAWNDLGPDRDKALKTIRRYAVEVRD
jgi:uncharacterized protein (DUF1330 family)